MSRVEDIMQMCRLCLDKDQVNTPIFDEPTDLNQTFLKISSCLPVKVSPEDNLPKKICDDCAYKLDMAYQFRNTSTNSEKQLIQLLDQIGIPPHQAPGKSEISVKLEHVAADDGDVSPGAQNYILQQQKLPYPQEFSEFGEEAPISESPPKKRAKRAAASKKPATVTKPPVEEIEEVETDPLIDASVVTKAEDDSDDSDNMALSSFATASATSSADQPGPSGIGKGATLNAPLPECIFVAPQEGLQVFCDEENKPLDQSSYICFVCNKTFPTQRKLSKHYRVHREKPFGCELCTTRFMWPSVLKRHMEIVHNTTTKERVCDVCQKAFKTDTGLQNHMLVHTNNYKHKCDLCGRGFVCQKAVQRHKEEKHEGRRYSCETCGMVFSSLNPYLEHSKQHDPIFVPKNYDCEICGRSCTDRHQRNNHLRTHREPKCFVCELCGKNVTTQNSLRIHMKIHAGEKTWVCETCGKAFVQKRCLINHIRVHTKEKPYCCSICNKGFAQSGSLTLHVRTHTGERPFECSKCFKGFITGLPVCIFITPQQGLQDFCNEESKLLEESSYFCLACNKAFSNKETLRRHNRAHREKVFGCELCTSRFFSRYALKRHVDLVHRITTKELVCDLCEKTFKTSGGLSQHILVHTNNYKHKCDLCGKGFVYQKAVQRHKQEIHEGTRYSCETCGKIFPNSYYFSQHLKTHDPNYVPKNYVCKVCEHSTTSRSLHQRHMKRHDDKRECFVCEICGKNLSSLDSLKTHVKRHMGEKSWVCDTCGKAFVQKQALVIHIRVHTKEKPHICNICSKSFSQKPTLNMHMRYHTGSRPYKCSVCDKGYVSKTLLKNHKCKTNVC